MRSITIAIFGGAGSGAIVAESIAAAAAAGSPVALLGYLNDTLPAGTSIAGSPVIGRFADWRSLPEDVAFIAPLHKLGVMEERHATIVGLDIPETRWATVIDPRSAVARDAQIGAGAYVGPFATIGPGSVLEAHVSIRGGAHVSHDCRLGRFAYAGYNTIISGYGTIGTGAYLAPGVTIIEHCRVGEFAAVGLGSVVNDDVEARTMVAGVPARRVRREASGA